MLNNPRDHHYFPPTPTYSCALKRLRQPRLAARALPGRQPDPNLAADGLPAAGQPDHLAVGRQPDLLASLRHLPADEPPREAQHRRKRVSTISY